MALVNLGGLSLSIGEHLGYSSGIGARLIASSVEVHSDLPISESGTVRYVRGTKALKAVIFKTGGYS
jgi:hypothetical protein